MGHRFIRKLPAHRCDALRRRARQRRHGVRRDRGGSAGVADLEQGLPGGLINSARQIGSALGVAALIDVAESVTAAYRAPAGSALAMGLSEALVVAAALAAVAFVVSAAFIRSEHVKATQAALPPRRVDQLAS